jgi:hypothetical protein
MVKKHIKGYFCSFRRENDEIPRKVEIKFGNKKTLVSVEFIVDFCRNALLEGRAILQKTPFFLGKYNLLPLIY